MIFTGDYPVSIAARRVLLATVARARAQEAAFATCDDLFGALMECSDGQVIEIFASIGQPPGCGTAHTNRTGDVALGVDDPNVVDESIRANRPLQQAVELAADGPAMTTGTLLLGLIHTERSVALRWLRAAGLTKTEAEQKIARYVADIPEPVS